MTMNAFLGIGVVSSPDAVERKTVFKVTRWQTRDKRRKNWRVMAIHTSRPTCFTVGQTLVMHPSLYAKLLLACEASGSRSL